MLSLLLRTSEFVFYHLLLSLVDRISRQPRYSPLPEAMRLYRENIALKAQLDALLRQPAIPAGKVKKIQISVRAAQVFAYLLTRGNEPFQHYSLSAPLPTIERWATRFRSLLAPRRAAGRPPLDQAVVDLIVKLKRENPGWGQKRIQDELRRLGIRVSAPTIVKVLRAHGFDPRPGHPLSFERVTAAAKDALWALDYFAFRTAKGAWLQVLLIIDVHTRELLELRAHEGWSVGSEWTSRTFVEVVGRSRRAPVEVVHDHGTHFLGQFERQLRVLDIGEQVTPPHFPQMNGFAEAAIGSVRRELLRHIRVPDAARLQYFLDEYRRYANTERAHQGLDGRTPAEVSSGTPEAAVIGIEELRSRRLERRDYANGLLHGYTLVEGGPTKKAA